MITKICKICKKEFTVHNYRKETALYCSGKCSHASKRQEKKQITCPSCRKKFIPADRRNRYCSQICAGKARQKRINKYCSFCGKEISVMFSVKNRKKFCSRKCMNLSQKETMKGSNNPFYGKTHSKSTREKISKIALSKKIRATKSIIGEYWHVYAPFHPFSKKRGYVAEHRLIMEKHLNRFLTKDEVIHHVNQNKLDNRIENLQLFATSSDHTRYHHKLRRESP